MSHVGPRFRLPFKRRREGKTDYQQRRAFVVSRRTRLVVRKSGRHIRAQLVQPRVVGDHVIVSADSGDLRRYGWKASSHNTSAAFLVGLLVGRRALSIGVNEAVLDIGLQQPTSSARIFAVLKGAIEAGMSIPHDGSVVPAEERIRGEHVAAYYDSLRQQESTLLGGSFSSYARLGLDPADISAHFQEIKVKIAEESGGD